MVEEKVALEGEPPPPPPPRGTERERGRREVRTSLQEWREGLWARSQRTEEKEEEKRE